MTTAATPTLAESTTPSRRWRPKRVLVTRSAYERDHGRQIVARCEAAGVPDIELLRGDRLPPLGTGDARSSYALAKSTLAVVVAPPSKLVLQPIPPSADWRFDLAEGCPAHCQYCYLAGSLGGPPITVSSRTLTRSWRDWTSTSASGRSPARRQRAGTRHDVRSVLLHRPARHRAPHRLAVRGDQSRRHP